MANSKEFYIEVLVSIKDFSNSLKWLETNRYLLWVDFGVETIDFEKVKLLFKSNELAVEFVISNEIE